MGPYNYNEEKKKSQVPVPKPLARRIKHDREAGKPWEDGFQEQQHMTNDT